VVEQECVIVGCGGYGIHDGSQLADLCWYGHFRLSCEQNGIDDGLDNVEMYLDVTQDRREWITKCWDNVVG